MRARAFVVIHGAVFSPFVHHQCLHGQRGAQTQLDAGILTNCLCDDSSTHWKNIINILIFVPFPQLCVILLLTNIIIIMAIIILMSMIILIIIAPKAALRRHRSTQGSWERPTQGGGKFCTKLLFCTEFPPSGFGVFSARPEPGRGK